MRFKAFVVVDGNGHIGLGVKACKEVAHSIQGGMILAKLNDGSGAPRSGVPSSDPPHTIPPRCRKSVSVHIAVSPRRRVVRVSCVRYV